MLLYSYRELNTGYYKLNIFCDLHSCRVISQFDNYKKNSTIRVIVRRLSFFFIHIVLIKFFPLMLPHNYSYESYDSIACSSLTWQGIVTTILHFWMINPVVTSLIWDSLFRNCNSNISSCTISNNIEYHVCGFHIVQMSIFQLSGLQYKYNTL